MPNAQTSSTNNSGCLILFGGLFAVVGFALLVNALVARQPDPAQTRTQLFVALTTLIIGLVLAAFGRSASKAAAETHALTAQNPGRPWLWRDDWARGCAKPEWRSTAASWGMMGALFVLVSAPALLAIPKNWHTSHRYETLIVLLFPLAGLYLLTQSAVFALRDSKFRDTRLKLSGLPGIIGGRVEGNLETAFLFPPGTQVRMTLSCVRSHVSGGGDDNAHWENALWQDTQIAPAYIGGPGTSVPVMFTTPYDARETDARNPSDEIFWKLTARAALPGIDFRADFRVPVFKTEASDASLTTEKLSERNEARLAGNQPSGPKITEAPSAEGGVQFISGRRETRE